jgi:uncharacterized membrane protein
VRAVIRLLFVLLIGLVGGGIVHIAAILGVPRFVEPDQYTRVGAFGPDFRFNALPRVTPTSRPLPLLDPAFAHALCRFSVAAEPVRIRVAPPDRLWTLALYSRRGVNVYHLNDRVGEGKPVELLVMTGRQVARLRENPPEDLESLSVVEWPGAPEGAALLRAYTPTAAAREEFAKSLANARCVPLSVSDSVGETSAAPAAAPWPPLPPQRPR